MKKTSKFDLKDIADLVSVKIKVALKGPAQPIFGRGVPQKDFNFQLQQLSRDISRLRQESIDSDKLFKRILNIYLKAEKTIDKKAEKGIRKTLSENFKALDKKADEFERAKKLYTHAKSSFGSNKAASKVLKEAENLLKEMENKYTSAQKEVDKIARKNYPGKLDDNVNSFVEELLLKLKKELKKIGKGIKIKPAFGDKDFLSLDEGKGGLLRFSRFIELVNIPKIDSGYFKKLYLVLTTDLAVPQMKKGRFVGLFSDIHIAFTPGKVRPRNLPKSMSLKDRNKIIKDMFVICFNSNIALFGNIVELSVAEKLKEFREIADEDKKAEEQADVNLKKAQKQIEKDVEKKAKDLEKKLVKRKKFLRESEGRLEKSIMSINKDIKKSEKELRPLEVQLDVFEKKIKKLEVENKRDDTNRLISDSDIKKKNIVEEKIKLLKKSLEEDKKARYGINIELRDIPDRIDDLEIEMDVELEKEEDKLLDQAKKDLAKETQRLAPRRKAKVKLLVAPGVKVKGKEDKVMVTMPQDMVVTKDSSLNVRYGYLKDRLEKIKEEGLVTPDLKKEFESERLIKKDDMRTKIKEEYESFYREGEKSEKVLQKEKKRLKNELKEQLEEFEIDRKDDLELFLEEKGFSIKRATNKLENQKIALEQELEKIKRQKKGSFVDDGWLEDLYHEVKLTYGLPMPPKPGQRKPSAKTTIDRIKYKMKKRKDGKVRFEFTLLPATKAEELPELGNKVLLTPEDYEAINNPYEDFSGVGR